MGFPYESVRNNVKLTRAPVRNRALASARLLRRFVDWLELIARQATWGVIL